MCRRISLANLFCWASTAWMVCVLVVAVGCKEPWDPADEADDDVADDDAGDDDTVDDSSCDEDLPAQSIAMDPECAVLQPYQLFEPNQAYIPHISGAISRQFPAGAES